MRQPLAIPARIGPAEFSIFNQKWVAVRCPSDLDPLMRKAGGTPTDWAADP